MGIVNFIAQHQGVSILYDVLDSKFPELARFLERLDNFSLTENLRLLVTDILEEIDDPTIVDLTKPLTITEAKAIIQSKATLKRYLLRCLSNEPFLAVAVDFVRELGFDEVSGVDVGELLANVAGHEGGK